MFSLPFSYFLCNIHACGSNNACALLITLPVAATSCWARNKDFMHFSFLLPLQICRLCFFLQFFCFKPSLNFAFNFTGISMWYKIKSLKQDILLSIYFTSSLKPFVGYVSGSRLFISIKYFYVIRKILVHNHSAFLVKWIWTI